MTTETQNELTELINSFAKQAKVDSGFDCDICLSSRSLVSAIKQHLKNSWQLFWNKYRIFKVRHLFFDKIVCFFYFMVLYIRCFMMDSDNNRQIVFQSWVLLCLGLPFNNPYLYTDIDEITDHIFFAYLNFSFRWMSINRPAFLIQPWCQILKLNLIGHILLCASWKMM